jgi:Flp pilus assembly protein TadG
MSRLKCERGSALVEVALIVSLFGIPLLIGTSEMGFLGYDSMEVSDAASAGASYAMNSATYAANTAGITTAAQTEAPDFGTALTVTTSNYYACSLALSGTQYTGASAQANATAGCTGTSNHPVQLVSVGTSATVTPKVRCPGLPATFTVTGSSVMEVEQ